MKVLSILFLACSLFACKEAAQAPEVTTPEVKKELAARIYPKSIAAVFEAHGGIDKWNRMNNLCFTIAKEEGNETHTIDLKSRKTRIETDKFTLGFDGKKVWLAQDSLHFQPGRARFYHNLMFYFYAMPFVLGDEGITYTEVAPLNFEGVSYPGTKISFGAGVGDAPDDEYILYQDPKTKEMAWLAYTVTYGKNEKSDRFSYIRYSTWQEVNGLQLPSKMQWYSVEEGNPVIVRSERTFIKPTATATQIANGLFTKPAEGEWAE